MRGKEIKVELLLGAIAVLLVFGAGGMLVRPAAEPDQTLRARIGDVVWNHELHARMKEIGNCTVCHHAERQGITNPKPCTECHKLQSNEDALLLAGLFSGAEEKKYSGQDGPPAMEIFHAKCDGCHKAMEQGPVGCRDCHAQSFSGSHGLVEWDHRVHARQMDMDCVRCHHKDTEAKWDGEYRSCSVCHIPASLKGLEIATGIAEHENARHGECYTCHTVANPENDKRSCLDCHPGLAVEEKDGSGEEALLTEGEALLTEGEALLTEGEALSMEQAIHARCTECHSVDAAEYKPTMPVYCTDCHKPDSSLLTEGRETPIIWSHKRHAEYQEWECNACHHTDIPTEPHTACYSCHGAGHFEGIPELPEALDKNCIGCHEDKGAGLTRWESLESQKAELAIFIHEEKTPESRFFWWDHRLHAVGLSLSCRECHHNTMVKDDAPVTEWLARQGTAQSALGLQSCSNCHGESGPVPGSAAEGSEARALGEVYKTVCVGCHEKLGCDPRTWDAFFDDFGLTAEGVKGHEEWMAGRREGASAERTEETREEGEK